MLKTSQVLSIVCTHFFYWEVQSLTKFLGGAMEHWKVLLPTMVGRQEKNSNSRHSRMAKTVIFWPWWQPFNSFCFETNPFFFTFVSLFSFCYAKKWGGGWGEGGGHGPLTSHLCCRPWNLKYVTTKGPFNYYVRTQRGRGVPQNANKSERGGRGRVLA